jgi:hypothetical protein
MYILTEVHNYAHNVCVCIHYAVFMLAVFMLSVCMLSVCMLSVCMLAVCMLAVCILWHTWTSGISLQWPYVDNYAGKYM